MNDYKQNITLSDAYGQGYLSLFYDFSSELLPHEMALLELLETLDYSNFDASLKRESCSTLSITLVPYSKSL